jgi:hypothetical protein
MEEKCATCGNEGEYICEACGEWVCDPCSRETESGFLCPLCRIEG